MQMLCLHGIHGDQAASFYFPVIIHSSFIHSFIIHSFIIHSFHRIKKGPAGAVSGVWAAGAGADPQRPQRQRSPQPRFRAAAAARPQRPPPWLQLAGHRRHLPPHAGRKFRDRSTDRLVNRWIQMRVLFKNRLSRARHIETLVA